MRLTKIEIIGFKSFKDRLSLIVPKGITAIVGPNGCGKSNIIDAVKWALGEQNPRFLRAKTMEDIIFAGTSDFAPVGMAEISLYFERTNIPFPEPYGNLNELVITRRLYRSGESEYLINKSPCRLKDIVDITIDTGLGQRFYGLIEQGMIESFMNYKPEEKRHIFEEVAGTAKYRLRKKATLQKLDAAKQNLDRVEDILSEVERNYHSLEKEAIRALEYKKIFDELKGIELYKNSINYKSFKEILAEKENKLKELTDIISDKELEFQGLVASLENKRNDLFFAERDFDEARKKLITITDKINVFEKELSSLKEGKNFRVSKIAELQNQIDGLIKEKEELNLKKGLLEEEIKNYEKELLEKEKRLREEENEDLSLKETLKKINNEVIVIQKELIRDKNQQSYLTSQINYEQRLYDDAIKRQEILDRELDELLDQIEIFKKEIETFKNELKEKELERQKTEEIINQKTNILIKEKKEVSDLRKKLQEKELKKERLSGFLNSSKKFIEDYGGFSSGSREVLKKFDKTKVFGSLLDFVEIDDNYLTLFENLFGDRLELIFVKDLDVVREVVGYLKEKKLGSCYFYTVADRGKKEVKELPSFIRSTTDREDIKEALCSLFDRIKIVEDLNNLELNESDFFATKDGIVIDNRGIIHGGIGEKHNPFLTERAKIKEMEEQLNLLNAEKEQLFQEIKAKEKDIFDTDNLIKEKREELSSLNIELSSGRTELKHKEEELKRRLGKVEMLKAEQKNLKINVESYLKKKKEFETNLTSLTEQIAKKEADILEKNVKLENLRAEVDLKSGKLTEIKVAIAEERRNLHHKKEGLIRLRDEIAKINKDLEYLNMEKNKIDDMDRDADKRVKSCLDELEVLKKEQGDEEVKVREKETLITDLRNLIRDWEKRQNQLRNEIEKIKKESDGNKESISEIILKLRLMEERIREKYFIELERDFEKFLNISVDEKDITDERIEVLSKSLKEFGEVNLLSIEEFEEVKKRYEFLKKQKEDIEQSIKSLNEAIDRINKVSIDLFTKSLKNIEENFDRVFKRLFNGGKARILLTDENNILESGVEIFVEVPHKKAKSIELLSGGEKALVALSLIFAFYMQKPSPFCLLDEVDAPLDDANVIKFRSLLKEMGVFSQFMVVTHNKILMEDVDALYGVTMETPGLSKIVSVKIERGELWQ